MVQLADHANLLTSIPTVEEVLNAHASELGHDFIAYRNHVYRISNLCLAIMGDSRGELEKIAVAATISESGRTTRSTTSLPQLLSRVNTSPLEGWPSGSQRSRR